jgi:hypothetical protein
MSSKREIIDFLDDILEAIADLRNFTSGMTFEEFCTVPTTKISPRFVAGFFFVRLRPLIKTKA